MPAWDVQLSVHLLRGTSHVLTEHRQACYVHSSAQLYASCSRLPELNAVLTQWHIPWSSALSGRRIMSFRSAESMAGEHSEGSEAASAHACHDAR